MGFETKKKKSDVRKNPAAVAPKHVVRKFRFHDGRWWCSAKNVVQWAEVRSTSIHVLGRWSVEIFNNQKRALSSEKVENPRLRILKLQRITYWLFSFSFRGNLSRLCCFYKQLNSGSPWLLIILCQEPSGRCAWYSTPLEPHKGRIPERKRVLWNFYLYLWVGVKPLIIAVTLHAYLHYLSHLAIKSEVQVRNPF